MADHSSMMSNQDRLIYMANQIARNFGAMQHGEAVAAVADHIASFWDPRMRAQIFALQAGNGARLNPVADAAVAMLREKGAPAPQTPATVFSGVHEGLRSDAG